jgi:hypothetical protein
MVSAARDERRRRGFMAWINPERRKWLRDGITMRL